ncbi:MAG TPA: hypothetical protein VK821_02285, partial [Dehalococcoidia bacterium]|nr:hypothetical protein [Dehalococcoidia bacterium]
VGRLSPLWNGAVWQSRDSFGVNTIGEPCDRKGHARFDGEALVWDGLYGCAVYAPAGNRRTSLARLRVRPPGPVLYPTQELTSGQASAHHRTYDAPLHVKVALALRNNLLKLRSHSNCCSHYGEPGC